MFRPIAMLIRKWLNKNRRKAIYIASGLAGFALLLLILELSCTGAGSEVEEAYFTVDDGKTWFADSLKRYPPFDHHGKPAVLARVFACGDEQFVAYLERYTDSARNALIAFDQAVEAEDPSNPPDPDAAREARKTGREVKRPGDATWSPVESKQGRVITNVIACPGGKAGKPEVALP